MDSDNRTRSISKPFSASAVNGFFASGLGWGAGGGVSAQYFEANIGCRVAFDAQMGGHRGQQLLHFGGAGVVGHQQAPLVAVDGARLDRCAQHRGNEEFHQLVTGSGLPRQSHQAGQAGRLVCGLFYGDGEMPTLGLDHGGGVGRPEAGQAR